MNFTQFKPLFLVLTLMIIHSNSGMAQEQKLEIKLQQVVDDGQVEEEKLFEDLKKILNRLKQLELPKDSTQLADLLELASLKVVAIQTQLNTSKNKILSSVDQNMADINSRYQALYVQNNELRRTLNETINKTGSKLSEAVLKSLDTYLGQYDRLSIQINQKEAEIVKLNSSVKNLSIEKSQLESKISSLESSKQQLIDQHKDQIRNISRDKDALEQSINLLKSEFTKIKDINDARLVSLGLSFGFNWGSKRYSYVVENNQTARENEDGGASGLISTLVMIRPKKDGNFNFLLNIPLAEIGILNQDNNGSQTTFFNEELSLGMGIGFSFTEDKKGSFVFIVNNRRVDRIDALTLEQLNLSQAFAEQPGTRLNLDTYRTITESNFTFTLGVAYRF